MAEITISSSTDNDFLSNLPDDILLQIFNRLPAKAVIHLISVSKQFKSLILNPRFIEDHISCTEIRPKYLLSCRWTRALIYHPCNNIYSWDYFEVPFPEYVGGFGLIGSSVRGVVCMRRYHDTPGLILWNPSIGKFIIVPSSTLANSNTKTLYGFGFDQVNVDFKVVQLSLDNDGNIQGAMVYEAKRERWKTVATNVPFILSGHPSVSVNGIVYWWARHNSLTKFSCIMSFDLVNEVFEAVELPRDVPMMLYPPNSIRLSTSSDGKSLVVFHIAPSLVNWNCRAWYLSKDSKWEKRYNLVVYEDYAIPHCIVSDELVLVLMGPKSGPKWILIDAKEGPVDASMATVLDDTDVMYTTEEFLHTGYTPSLALLLSDHHTEQNPTEEVDPSTAAAVDDTDVLSTSNTRSLTLLPSNDHMKQVPTEAGNLVKNKSHEKRKKVKCSWCGLRWGK